VSIGQRGRGYWLGAAAVLAVLAAYFALFHLPPRLVGSNDPDRYFHLALARMVAEGGWPRILPQVEDLGWGRFFPDKEFLFHALGGLAWKLGGPVAVNLLVPLLGMGIGTVLYASLARLLPPWKAALLALLPLLLCPAFLFRITLLRPHLLAIFCFCLLLHALLSRRRWLAAVACAGFALSYHALYIPALALGLAALLLREPERRLPTWAAAGAGLVAGIVCNPYFPDTLLMSWSIVKIALSMGMPPGMVPGNELLPLGPAEYLYFFAGLALAVPLALVRMRGVATQGEERANYLFLALLSAALLLLSLRSARATEYAIPATVLLLGHWWRGEPARRFAAAALLAMAAVQLPSSLRYLQDSWTLPQGGDTPLYFNALARLPAEADGGKLFTCEWQTGSYVLYARPRLRFVDLLDPALLWQADPQRYRLRRALASGELRDPWRALREVFDADYVACADALSAQMAADPAHFEELRGGAPSGPLRVFRVRAEATR
jgi:hypothetical protein